MNRTSHLLASLFLLACSASRAGAPRPPTTVTVDVASAPAITRAPDKFTARFIGRDCAAVNRFLAASSLRDPPTAPWPLPCDPLAPPEEDQDRYIDPPDWRQFVFKQPVYGKWPDDAYLATFVSTSYGENRRREFWHWTSTGWEIRRAYFGFTSHFLGLGRWPGGRIITPITRKAYEMDLSNWNDDGSAAYASQDQNKLVVVSGPPADDLPDLPLDPTGEAVAFTSFDTGDAIMVYSGHSLSVRRWRIGEKTPKHDSLADMTLAEDAFPAFQQHDIDRLLIAYSPNEIYVTGLSTIEETKGQLVVAEFDGSAWSRSLLPRDARLLRLVRSSDGTLWALCDSAPLADWRKFDIGQKGTAAGLFRRRPGETFQRVLLPPMRGEGGASVAHVEDIWPGGTDELWLRAWGEEAIFKLSIDR